MHSQSHDYGTSGFTDRAIIDGICSNDQKVYIELYASRTGDLRNFVENNNGSVSDADEIEQKAIVVLFENVLDGSFQLTDDAKLSTYLFAVGRNLWLKTLNKRKASNIIVTDQIPDRSDELDHGAFEAQDEQELILIEALNEMHPLCVTLIRAQYYQKVSDKLLSEKHEELNLNNIRKRRYKCIQKLKSIFLSKNISNG